jgi:hydrogenase nickel incorporation protein HypB
MRILTIERKLLEKNDVHARRNRERLQQHGILCFNLVSSPGSGKTMLIERTLSCLGDEVRFGVIEGDVQTDLDARRVAAYGVPTVQLVTNGGCHLEANLVSDALKQMPLAMLDALFIENVGNLVCPANYDLGEHAKIVIVSVTEGDDKPLKYPPMFREAAVLVVNKVDLLPHLTCDLSALVRNALDINPALRVFRVSAQTGEGIDDWCAWLKASVDALHEKELT